MSPHVFTLCVLFAATVASADPQILLFPSIGRPGEITVHGRVLREAPTPGSSVLARNLRRLTAPDWDGAPVEVTFHGSQVKTRAGSDGVFEARFSFEGSAAPAPGIREVHVGVPGAWARSFVRLMDPKSPFLLISDFDDTVAVTNVTDRTRFVTAALLQDSDTQPAVEGMSALYQCLVDEQPVPSALAFVSGSPHQYARRISAFLSRNGFPTAGLYLRDLSPNTLSSYKQPLIRKLLRSVDQSVILIGDSGEHDPEVYAQIRREYPDRVLAIYIRDIGRSEDARRFQDMMLFKDPREAAANAVQRGFMSEECRARKFSAEAKPLGTAAR
jgi:phosphatidate phosphatase APP1